jgi:hypothetical protein
LLKSRDHPHQFLLHLGGQGSREAVQVHLVRVVAFRLKEELMPRLI